MPTIYSVKSVEDSKWQGKIIDFTCPKLNTLWTKDFFHLHQTYGLFGGNESSIDTFQETFKHQEGVRLDSDISIFTLTGLIYDIYKIDNVDHWQSEIIIEPNGYWNDSGIFNYQSTTIKLPLRNNLRKVQLPAVIYVSREI